MSYIDQSVLFRLMDLFSVEISIKSQDKKCIEFKNEHFVCSLIYSGLKKSCGVRQLRIESFYRWFCWVRLVGLFQNKVIALVIAMLIVVVLVQMAIRHHI